jgi:hypothetical protein
LLQGPQCDALRQTLRRTHRPDCGFNRVATGTPSTVPCPLENPVELGSKGRRVEGLKRRRAHPRWVDQPAGSRHLVLAASIRLPSGTVKRITTTRGWRGSPCVDEDPRHAESAPEFAAPGADAAAGVCWVGPTVGPRVRMTVGSPRHHEPARPGQVGAMTR